MRAYLRHVSLPDLLPSGTASDCHGISDTHQTSLWRLTAAGLFENCTRFPINHLMVNQYVNFLQSYKKMCVIAKNIFLATRIALVFQYRAHRKAIGEIDGQ